MANNVKNRYYIQGKLELLSPMIVGSGENEKADIQAIRDWNGNLIIPGTTLAGNIRHSLVERSSENIVDKYFGSNEQNSGHSLFSFFDAETNEKDITDIRDGVRLDNLTKTTADKSKYDYEIVNEGSVFNFRMEAVMRAETNKSELKSVLSEIIDILENGHLCIGAKTSRGFGKVKLNDTKIQEIDIVNDQAKWIDYSWGNLENNFEPKRDPNLFTEEKNDPFSVEFTIPNSLIIKSYSADPNDVDSSMLTSNGKPIISGPSWNGAIRHALKHVGRELGKQKEMQKLIRNTFGWVYLEDNKFEGHVKGDVIPSKVTIDESKIEDGEMIPYTRNKVDRFTGGVVDGALFDEKPVYGGKVNLNMEIKNAKDYEKGMVILALKELQNGIQTVGGGSNIGRGRLENNQETFTDDDTTYLSALAEKLNSEGGQQ